jgi:hypothetical protein
MKKVIELKSLNKDDEAALFVKFKKFCQNFKKEGKFVHFKSPIKKKSLTNCNTCKKSGHWAKNCLAPYEKVMKNWGCQEEKTIEDKSD